MKHWIWITVVFASYWAVGQATTGTCKITASGGTCTIANSVVGGMNATFEELPAGTPATVSITVQGCMRGGTCDTAADTNTSTAAANRGVAFTKPYNYFLVTASWTGGTSPSVTVNNIVTSAKSSSGSGAVASVFGRTGAVVAANGDYTCAQVTNCASVTFQVDAVTLISSSTINFQDSNAFNGLTFTFSNPLAGNVKAGFSGALGPGGIGTLVAGSNGLAASATTDTTNASNISSGLLGLARGGTNANLSATGGTSQFLKQASVGAAITVVQPACADLSNAAASCSTDATNATNLASGTVNAARESSSVVQNNIANTAAAGMTFDMSGATGATAFKVPVIAGATAGANGVIDYDSTNGNTHFRTNAADSLGVAMAAALTAGTIPKATDATHGLLSASAIVDNGTVVTSSEGLAFSGAAGAATTISTTATNAALHLAPNGTGQVLIDTDGSVTLPAQAYNSQPGLGWRRIVTSTLGLTNGTKDFVQLKAGQGVTLPANGGFSISNNSTDATTTQVACLDDPTTGGNTWRISSTCADNASPVVMTVRGMGSRGGTDTNIAGADIIYQPGIGTGNSTPAKIRFQAPGDTNGSGSGQQATPDRLVINGTKTLSTTTATATTVFTLSSANTNRSEGGVVHYQIIVNDGTDWCSLAGEVTYVLVAKASTRSSATSTPIGETKIGSGTACATLSTTWAFAAASDALQVTPAFTGITPTSVRMRYSVFNNGDDTISTF